MEEEEGEGMGGLCLARVGAHMCLFSLLFMFREADER